MTHVVCVLLLLDTGGMRYQLLVRTHQNTHTDEVPVAVHVLYTT